MADFQFVNFLMAHLPSPLFISVGSSYRRFHVSTSSVRRCSQWCLCWCILFFSKPIFIQKYDLLQLFSKSIVKIFALLVAASLAFTIGNDNYWNSFKVFGLKVSYQNISNKCLNLAQLASTVWTKPSNNYLSLLLIQFDRIGFLAWFFYSLGVNRPIFLYKCQF